LVLKLSPLYKEYLKEKKLLPTSMVLQGIEDQNDALAPIWYKKAK